MNSDRSQQSTGVFTPPKPLKIRAICATDQGKQRRNQFFDTMNHEWRGALAPKNGVEFFNSRHEESLLMVYPIEIGRFNQLSGFLKCEVIHTTLVFDDESLLALIDREMLNWLLPPANLIAVGFTPDWAATNLPSSSPIRKMTTCPKDSSKEEVFREIVSEKAGAAGPEMPPVPRVDAELSKKCSIM